MTLETGEYARAYIMCTEIPNADEGDTKNTATHSFETLGV